MSRFFRFTIRDLLWFTLAVAAALGSWCWREPYVALLQQELKESHGQLQERSFQLWSAKLELLDRQEALAYTYKTAELYRSIALYQDRERTKFEEGLDKGYLRLLLKGDRDRLIYLTRDPEPPEPREPLYAPDP